MAGTPWNRLSADEHRQRGTYRADRHADRPAPAPSTPVSEADRRRTLKGLDAVARRLAVALLDEYDAWDAASLVNLRLYVESAARLATMTDDAERRRETRTMLALHKALRLEQAR